MAKAKNGATTSVATKPAAKESTALSTDFAKLPGEAIDPKSLRVVALPGMISAISENLQGEQLSERDLDRVKVPAGGGTVWQVPTIDGEKNVEKLVGVMLYSGVRRAYWEDPNPSGSPPDCASKDGLIGIGDPGVECAACRFNQFGTAIKANGKEGAGKACREMRAVLLLRPEDAVPKLVQVPPSSLRALKNYLLNLPCPMYQALTELSLVKTRNDDGIDYSEITFRYAGYLPSDAVRGLATYAQTLRSVLIASVPTSRDAEVDRDGDASFDPDRYESEPELNAAGD